MRYNRNNKGYTLVELMIASVVGMILIAGATTTFIVQNRSYSITETVSELNSQSKTSLDIIAEDLRNAGGGTPSDLGANPINGQDSIISFTDGGNAAPDSITLLGGFRVIGNIAANPASPAQTVNGNNIWIANAEGSIDMDDRMNINIDGTFFARIVSCDNTAGECTKPDNKTGVFLNRPLISNDALPVGRPVYLIEDITYCLSGTNLRRIRRNANPTSCVGDTGSDDELIAQNIEDLQFAYAVDGNDADDEVDIGNGNPAILDDADFIDGSAVLNPDRIRAVRISVLGIANRPDRGVSRNPPALIENHVLAPTGDGFKRRLWQTVVTVQNMQR